MSLLNACACLGPMYGEPKCYCQMVALKLPLNEAAREAERIRSEEQLAKLFGPGGLFETNRNLNNPEKSNVQQES